MGGPAKLMTRTYSLLLSIMAGTLFVTFLLGALVYFDLQLPLLSFANWLKSIGIWAALLFTLIDMLMVICLLPSILFTLAAGFLFGAFGGGFVWCWPPQWARHAHFLSLGIYLAQA